MTLNDLVDEFANCVIAQSEAIDRGDSYAANQFAARYISVFEQLKGYGNEGRNALATLLSHERSAVRVMAAAYLLRHCTQKAMAVLEAEAVGTDIVAFGASQALQRWKDGSWSLDPI